MVKKETVRKPKKRIVIIIFSIVLILCCIPFAKTTMEDGGTWVYMAIGYKVVDWNRYQTDSGDKMYRYQNTCVYPFPLNFLSEDKLWEMYH